ncbi:MAG TPA: coproporphyrinogen III oxidase family protein, partial [Verrucomicrobiae bacterium]|nr:coproporphyrinogen III oxidase family protein [Verrucomicrobiae bacterium]
MSLGIYISVPFCRSKCTYCNFASGVFSAAQMARYVERVCEDIATTRGYAAQLGARVPEVVDSIYLGGGTPSLLPTEEL